MAEVLSQMRVREKFPDNHFVQCTMVPGGDVLLKCFVMLASTVSRMTYVYPLRGWWLFGLFALKMGALLSNDTHTSNTADINVYGQ